MAYFIFLKYMRSLEEFMKNPYIKIPPKSPPTNFQSLCIFKNLIFIRKRIFLHFRPNRPSGQPTQPQPTCFFNWPLPLSPLGLSPLADPADPRVGGALPGCRLPHGGSASSHAAFALSSHPADRWTPPIIPHLRPARARPCHHHLPPLPSLPLP
jgi:hypothetical protein